MVRPDEYVPTNYLAVLIMLIVGFIFGLGGLIFGSLVRPKFSYKEKLIPYECGNEPSGLPWQKIAIRYYPIAILFAVFDVELGLIYPWTVGFSGLTSIGFLVMIVFLLVLLLGLVYDLKKGILDWHRR
jgi:NADH-quinone oxidoreductase subunit A